MENNRAKIFMPFDALPGFREALAERERIAVPRSELSADTQEELDRKLKEIRPGDLVTALYYSRGEYVKLCGPVSKTDGEKRILQIAECAVPFSDLARLVIHSATASDSSC